jgi:hypothetical protein
MPRLIRVILKASLLPAAILIVGKLLGLVLGNALFGLNMYIGNDLQGIFSVQLFFTSAKETLIANSFSNAIMLLTLSLGFILVFTKFSLYQSSQSNPRTLVKLVKLNLLGWITSNKGGIIDTIVWAIFLWISCIIIITHSIQGSSYEWIGLLATLAFILSFWRIVDIIEKEMQRALPQDKILY